MKLVSGSTSTNTRRMGWMVWFVCLLIGRVRADDGNNTATTNPARDFEPALQCGNRSAYSNQDFVVLLGGRPGDSTTGSTNGNLPVPQDMPVGPSCGSVLPSGRGFWFPIQPESQGQIEMIFCTNTAAATLVPIVYTAPRITNTTTSCEELYCVAEGITNPLRTTEPILSQGTICPDSSSYDGVRFVTTDDQFYFVYVDVTSETTELDSLQVTTMVAELAVANDFCSSSIGLMLESQTITTDDFVNVQMDLVPQYHENFTSIEAAESYPIVWTDEWKGVWYTLPREEMYIDQNNHTLLGVDLCSNPKDVKVRVTFFRGTDCEHLLDVVRVAINEHTCSMGLFLPYDREDPSKIYYMFVHTDKDPTIEGRFTVKLTLNGTSTSSSADFQPWWGMVSLASFAVSVLWLL